MTAPSQGLVYTDTYPVAASVQTQGAGPNDAGPVNLPDPNVDINTYIDPAIGGVVGPVGTNGYSTGLNPGNMPQPLTGLIALFPAVDLSGDTGPVGRENWAGTRAAGVNQQLTPPPDLETIYKSLVNNG